MFDISLIPMFVYIFIFIPPIIVGALKGWKISIFYTLILFGLMSGVILILSTTYDAWVFDAFDYMFIKPKIVSGVDSALLSDFTKQSAIGLFAAMAMPIMMLITWSLFKLLTMNKVIFNFFYRDKSTVISANEVEIIKDIHSKKHYILGSFAGAIQGLYLSSIIVTAAATLTMPAGTSDFFVNSSNTLAHLFSFGQAGYGVDYQYAYDWMTSATSEYFSAFDFIVNIFDETKRPTDEQMLEFDSSLLARDLANFYSNDTMSRLIIASLVGQLDTRDGVVGEIKVLDESAPGNPNGFTSLEKDDYISSIEAWKNSNTYSIKINPKAAEDFVQYLKTKVADFENTRFFTDWKTAWDEENTALGTLNFKKSELSNLKIAKLNLESKIERLTNEIAKATADLGPAGIDLTKKEALKDAALIERDAADAERLAKQIIKDDAINEMQVAQSTVSSIENEISAIDSQISNANSIISTADTEMPKLQTVITNLTTQITALQNELLTATGDRLIEVNRLLAEKTAEKQTAQATYNMHSQNKTNATSEKTTLTSQRATKVSELNTAKSVLASKTSAYNTALTAYNTAMTNLTNKEAAYNTAIANYNAALDKVEKLSGDLETKSRDKIESQTLLTETNTRITTLEAGANVDGSIAKDEVLYANKISIRKPLSIEAFGTDGGDDTTSALNAKNYALEGSKKNTYNIYLERYLDVYRAILK